MTVELTPEQRRMIDKHGGLPIFIVDTEREQRFILLSDSDSRVRDLVADVDAENEEWTEEKERRRRELIDKDITGEMAESERAELAFLDRLGGAHYDRIAPRPLGGLRDIHRRLLDRHAGA